MKSEPAQVDEESLRILADELAQQVLTEVAPEELALFEDTAQQYHADPEAVLDPKHRDEALGFGLELAMLSPVVIMVALSVVQWLAKTVIEAAIKESSPSVMSYLRRLFRSKDAARTDAKPLGLTADQTKQVRALAYEKALAAGVSSDQAKLIADATAGALVMAG